MYFVIPASLPVVEQLRLAQRAGNAYGDGVPLSVGLPKAAEGMARCAVACGAWGVAERLAPCPRCGCEHEPVPLDDKAIPDAGLLLAGDPLLSIEAEHDAKIAEVAALLERLRAEKDAALKAKG